LPYCAGGYDERGHTQALEKQEEMKRNSVFEMTTLKKRWSHDMEQLEATFDQKEVRVALAALLRNAVRVQFSKMQHELTAHSTILPGG
jgi:hypothetical protein